MRVFAHTRAAYLCEELVGNRGEAENVGTHKGAGASASASDIPSIVANTAASAIVARRTKPPDRLRLAALLMATAADVEAPADAVADGRFNPVGLGRFFVTRPCRTTCRKSGTRTGKVSACNRTGQREQVSAWHPRDQRRCSGRKSVELSETRVARPR